MERLSANPEARWLKKGKKSYFGYKGFWRTDEEGYVERVMACPANEAETLHFGAMLEGCTAIRFLADKAHCSAANVALRAKARMKSGIRFQAARGHPLNRWRKTFNQLEVANCTEPVASRGRSPPGPSPNRQKMTIFGRTATPFRRNRRNSETHSPGTLKCGPKSCVLQQPR